MSRKIAVVDSETDPFKFGRIPAPFIWGFYDGERYEQFTDTAKLVEFLRGQRLVVYAHNGGKFDWHFLLEYLNEFQKVKIINGRLAVFKIGLCEFRDSYNILPVPLSAYQKEKFDYKLMEASERYKPENWKKIEHYLYTDCKYLFEVVTGFIEQYGFHLTQAGAAMKTWEKMADRKAPRSTQQYYELLSPYYYGGRVQCFQTGIIHKKFSVIDINSAYPYAMLHQHPIGLEYDIYDPKLPVRRCRDGDRERSGLYKIRCRSKGAFPYRGEDGRLYFPDDNNIREYHVTGWEYFAAIETNTISKPEILQIRTWKELTDFEDYITHFYELRKRAKEVNDKQNDLFSKLLMNSLYGKFGANPADYSEYMIVDPRDGANMIKDGYDVAGELGPWLLGEKDLELPQMRYFNVATAASITGFVRAYLWRAICQCKGVMYCDTDSIAAEHISGIELGNELGQWKEEGIFNRAGIGGRKLYVFYDDTGTYETKKASKGVRLSPREIWDIARGEVIDYVPENPTFSIHTEPRFTDRVVYGPELTRPGIKKRADARRKTRAKQRKIERQKKS